MGPGVGAGFCDGVAGAEALVLLQRVFKTGTRLGLRRMSAGVASITMVSSLGTAVHALTADALRGPSVHGVAQYQPQHQRQAGGCTQHQGKTENMFQP